MKCSVVYAKDINNRLDAYYYSSKYEIDRLIQSSKFTFVELEDLGLEMRKGIFDLNPSEYLEEGVPFIRISNITDAGISFHSMVYISEQKNEIERKTQLIPGDLAFAKIGTVDRVGMLPNNYPCYNISQNIIGIKLATLDRDRFNPDFLRLFFQLGLAKEQLKRLATHQVQYKLTLNALQKIRVPVIPLDTQNKIINLMNIAYNTKTAKEAEAQKLLYSIDEYVLEELGIKIDYKPHLTFVTYSNQATQRFDPLYHCQDVYHVLNDYKGNIAKLGDHIEYAQSGFAAGYSNQEIDGSGIIQIRPTNISDDRRLVFDRNIYVKHEALEKQPGDILVKGEVLFNNTNSQELVGKSLVFNLDRQYFCSNHITRIKVKDADLVTDYLTAILNLYQRRGVFYRICTNWNNQSGINVELLKTVKIPLPALEAQKNISTEIQSRMNQADELQKLAKAEVDTAKAEVERLILGN